MKMENVDDVYPLSPMQQGMLFHTLYAPQSGIYFEQLCCILHGELNVLAFKQAWQMVLDRHPALRTCFLWEGLDVPLQIVKNDVTLAWFEQDLRELSKPEQQGRLSSLLDAERKRGFVLSQAPLMRCVLLRMDDNKYQFVWNNHHLLTDGWSLSIVLKEVFIFYQAVCQNKNLRLEPAPAYRDYIAWLQQQDHTQAELFWQKTLQGISSPTPLIVNKVTHSETNSQVHYGEKIFHLSCSVTACLQSLAKQHHLTLSTMVQGGWALLLSRYSGEDDVIFGTTVSGRTTDLLGVEQTVGLFINTLPVRVMLQAETCLLQWLKQLQADQVEREQYAYSPLVEIQGWSDIARGKALFESLVVVENYPLDDLLINSLHSIEIEDVRSIERTNYPLTLSVTPGDELLLELSYDCNQFNDTTISRLATHLSTLLASMASDLNQALKDVSLLSADERQQLLVQWNQTHMACPRNFTIQQLFEAQVERNPDAVALVFNNERLSYQALNCRANQLAHKLQSLGVSAEVMVGICVERSVNMVVAVLAVLKAGGVYVPLDPSYPKQRLGLMLQDTQLPLLLTQQSLLADLPECEAYVLCLDSDSQSIAQQSEQNVRSNVKPDNLAYVIYTSGTTNKPKGVAINHHSLVNAYHAWEQAYQLQSTCTSHLQMAGFSFDVFSGDLIRALCSGAKLVLCARDWLLEPKILYELMCSEKVDCAEFVPAVLRNLIQYLRKAGHNLHFMRLLVVGSDSWYVEEYKEFQQFCGSNTRFINSYGVTEASIDSTFFEATAASLPMVGLVPIGRPFANTQIYILDRQLQAVPVGVAGELYIAGAGLARGYLNLPGLTRERFIHNPYQAGTRLYKTGDFARYLVDGNIEFLGRLDQQVKVRGFRIEPGEVESVLCQHQAVREALVIVREERIGDKRLVAYVVLENDKQANSIDALRDFICDKLPEYMRPNAFVALQRLPLTASGKVDRSALPAPQTGTSDSTHVAVCSPAEELLVGIWADVLGLERIGMQDNFFQLGGHSLLATQVISRIRDTFNVELSVRCLFESPTPQQLNVAIESAKRTHSQQQQPLLEPVDRSECLPLSFVQQQLWFLDQLEGQSATYNIPVALRISGSLDIDALAQSFTEIIRRHEILRTRFPMTNGIAVQIIDSPSAVSMPVVDLQLLATTRQSAKVQQLAAEEARLPFDLATGPLLRISLLRLGNEHHVLLLTMHHIVSDAWSLAVLVQELSTLYKSVVTGSPSSLSELTIQYADYAKWQRQWLNQEVLDTQLNYWRQQLAGAATLLELPTDRPRPPVQTFQGSTQHFQLDVELLQGIKALARQTGTTLFMTLLAGFISLLFRYSRQQDIVVGSPIANRNQRQTESLIGCFINTLVLRTDLSQDPTFYQLLDQVRQVALDAYAHQDVPFEQLVEALQPQRDLSHSPVFQVLFVLQNTPLEDLQLAGLTVTPLAVTSPAAKYDISMGLTETEQGLSGELEYNSDLFDAATIDRMLCYFQTLLNAIVTQPELRVSEFPLLSNAEQQQLLQTWNQTQLQFADDRCIHQLFEAEVERNPHAVALLFNDQQLTYQQLNARSNQLAHYLQGLGVAAEALVGVCVQRSPAMIIGLLGILKAGAAYVPLDPNYPKQRLSHMLEDAQLSVVVTEASLVSHLPQHNAQLVCLDSDWACIAQQNQQNLESAVSPENLAYVIYTSGSTGVPKGVLVAHQGLCNLAKAQIKIFDVQASSRVLQFASFSFDASVSEVFMALCAGAGLCLASVDDLLPGPALIRLLRAQAVTHATFPPSALAVLPTEELPVLQTIIVAGEDCPRELLARWSLDRNFFNAYGPTEATVCSTAVKCSDASKRPSIGKPIDNTMVYVLDEHLQCVPIGVPGELYIGGIGLARGYLNLPQLTAERFIRNPYETGQRIYKTGDLGRYLADGNIEFLGRLDQQVKIRGFRIEPGEIENALSMHHEISNTVVLAKDNEQGDKSLTAFVTRNRPIELWPSIAEFFVYDDVVYSSMANHESRNQRYLCAFRKVLNGKKVIEIGPGPEAILSRLAIQAGAEKVYAIEYLEDTYHQAQQTVASLGLQQKIILIHGDATQVELPEKVDYCISEIVGSIGGAEGAAKIINSSRRFLHHPQCMIPQRSITKIAAITLPESSFEFAFPQIAAHYVDKIFSQLAYKFDLRICLKNLPLENVISTADVFEDLDYTVETPLEMKHDITLEFEQDAVFHGLLVWLTLHTDQQHIVDTLEEQESWLPVYLPLFQNGIEVAQGDIIKATVDRRLSENNLNPDYFIQGRILRDNDDVLAFEYNCYHFKSVYRETPFYAKLFADDKIPQRHSLSIKTLRSYLAERLPNYMIPAHIVELPYFPLNTSGKIDRHALLAVDISNSNKRTHVAPRTSNEELLAEIWGTILGLEQVGVHDNFFELGGDSILSIQVVARASQAGLQFAAKQLFQHQTIAELAAVANTRSSISVEQGLVTGAVPLTPIQQWFFEQNMHQSHHYNQSVLLQTVSDLQPELLQRAARQLMEQHDALRLRFVYDNGEWLQLHTDLEQRFAFNVVDLSALTPKQQQAKLERVAERYQSSLKLEQGPLLRLVLFQMGAKRLTRLLLIIHHLVVDGVSWRILLEDLRTAYQQLSRNQEPVLPAKTSSFKQWSERLTQYAQSNALCAEVEYWMEALKEKVVPLPVDYEDNAAISTMASTAKVSHTLNEKRTKQLLQQVPAAYNTQINDVLLTALVMSVNSWTGQQSVLIDLEGHGREDLFEEVDLSRTVGWFTTVFPLVLTLAASDTLGVALKNIKEQLRRIPNRGIGYGMLNYLNTEPTIRQQLQSLPQAELSFNYLGQFDQLQADDFMSGLATESSGQDCSPLVTSKYLLEVQAQIIAGKLELNWVYNERIYRRSTVEALVQVFLDSLQTLIGHCMSTDAGGYTPSDFPDVELNQQQFERVMAAVGETGCKKIESIYTLSPSQQGMLLETLSTPASGIHVEQSVWRLRGNLDLQALQRAWKRVIERHAVLRTVFVWQDLDVQLQVVLHSMDMPTEYKDLRQMSSCEQKNTMTTYLEADRRQGFELSNAPLMHLVIFQMQDTVYDIVWTHHHILMDGWCINLIAQDMLALLEAFTLGHDVQLAASRPYGDYIRWLKQQDLIESAKFWQRSLPKLTRTTAMGISTGSIKASTQAFARQTIDLTAAISQRLRSLIRSQHVTENVLMQSLWAMLLSRYSGDSEVVFGATVSGRPAELEGVESMVGLFINTLPMYFSINPEAQLWPWIRAAQNRQIELSHYEYCSNAQIHQWIEMPNSQPLYESIMVFENYPADANTADSSVSITDVTQDGITGGQTNHALVLFINPDTELQIELVYDTQRFEKQSVSWILTHFVYLIESLVDVPEQSLAQLMQSIPAEQIPRVAIPTTQQLSLSNVAPPRDSLELKLKQIWSNVLDISHVGVHDNFFELGGHSLIAVRLMAKVQQEFARMLPLAALLQAPTIAQLAVILRQQTTTASWSSLVPIQPKGSATPLFCVPGAGGNVIYLQALAHELGLQQPFYGLQAVGLDGQATPHTNIEDMATHYIEVIRTVQPQGPYLLAGHSFGGWVAFEIAQQLQKQGHDVSQVYILDTPAPVIEIISPVGGTDDTAVMLTISKLAERLFNKHLKLSQSDFDGMDTEAQLHYLTERLQAVGVLPCGIGIQQVRGMVQVYKAIDQIQYIPKEALPTRITLLRAKKKNPQDDFNDKVSGLAKDRAWGWDRFALPSTQIYVVPGDHISMLTEPHVQSLAEQLNNCIEKINNTEKQLRRWK